MISLTALTHTLGFSAVCLHFVAVRAFLLLISHDWVSEGLGEKSFNVQAKKEGLGLLFGSVLFPVFWYTSADSKTKERQQSWGTLHLSSLFFKSS